MTLKVVASVCSCSVVPFVITMGTLNLSFSCEGRGEEGHTGTGQGHGEAQFMQPPVTMEAAGGCHSSDGHRTALRFEAGLS